MLNNPNPIRAALLATVAAMPGQGIAQDADQDGGTVLETLTVTGNWLDEPSEEKVLKHAGAHTIIGRKQIDESGASNIRDVLRQVPGVEVQDSNGTGGSDVSLNLGVRGLTSRLSPRSTVLVDGIPLSYAPYGQPQLSLFPLILGNVDTVDFVRGGSSVRYGPKNVVGIINFVTRPIPQDFVADLSAGTEIYGNNGHVKATPSFFAGGKNADGLGAALLYSGIHGEGYRDSNDRSDIDDLILKGTYDLTDTDKLSAQLHHYNGEGEMPGGLTTAEYDEDPYQSTRRYDDFKGRRNEFSLRYQHDDGENNFERLTYYVNSFRGSHVEQQGTGANAGLYRLTSAPRIYEYFGIEPRYSRVFELGGTTQEVTIGYRYLWEKSSEVAARTSFYYRASGIDPRYATYTYTEATYEAGAFKGRGMPFYSRNFGSIGASYKYNDWLISSDVLAQSKQHSPGTATDGAEYVTGEDPTGRLGDIPGYATVNLRIAYQPEDNKNAPEVAFGVKNLFDKAYFTRATDNNGGKFVGQPRTFVVNASVAF